MRLKNCIDYKCFPEPSRGDWTRFTILVLSAWLIDYQLVTTKAPKMAPILWLFWGFNRS